MPFVRKHYMADPHFGHAAILRSQPVTRPFSTTEEMDAAIIEKVNERVETGDLLFILGDFAFSKDDEYLRHVFHSLRGRKVLVLGNHDVDNRGAVKKGIARLPWDIPPVMAMETKDGPNGSRVWLSHYAHRAWPAQHYGSYHFYGHSHGAIAHQGRSRDVGIDVPDMGFGPMTFEDLTKDME
ncbi:hypothetical protein ACTJK5_09520 [Agrobacterium sp. 22094]|uniref:hypothetical protein n=1 Tax=Agrobacterium sp. 22094 TaxID=3453872 RepID=UPI003F859E6E